jgi:phytoene/squalene synthetase
MKMQKLFQSSQELAAAITKAGSKQTYYTLRYLVDRQQVPDALRAYAYFRWLDDRIDEAAMEKSEQVAFMDRQKALMGSFYQGRRPSYLTIEEEMLAALILADQEKNSGLQSYIRKMMAVIDFDARRRGRPISRVELVRYSKFLAVAVTDVLHHFIGHSRPAPESDGRYQAVTGAHITHMLRDTHEDLQAGYFNIPREYLVAKGIDAQDVESDAYRAWAQERVDLAQACFRSGKDYLAHVQNIRLRIAGYAYIARFEAVLDDIKKLNYRLAPAFLQEKSLGDWVKMRSVLSLAFFPAIRK